MSNPEPDPEPAPEPAATEYGGCSERVTVDDVRACCAGIDGVADETVGVAVAEALYQFDLATDFAFRGVCSATIRPCRVAAVCGGGTRGAEMLGQVWPLDLPLPIPGPGGLVGSWPCSCSTAACSCTRLDALRLPFLPVREVTSVKVDGAELDPADWRLLPGTNLLVRADGSPWPTAQDPLAEDTEPDTWSVTFVYGFDLPPGAGRRVAGFACELARACSGMPCSLPERARLQRKGDVEYVVYDNYREQGLTGYPPLDDWIANRRGGRARIRPSLARPGARRGTSRAWRL